MATPISNVRSDACVRNRIIYLVELAKSSWFPKITNNKWPAIILAVNRIANVAGRISILVDSIITIKGINMAGVPWGTKCLNNTLVKFTILNIIIPNQIGRDIVILILKCLVELKI